MRKKRQFDTALSDLRDDPQVFECALMCKCTCMGCVWVWVVRVYLCVRETVCVCVCLTCCMFITSFPA